LSIYGVSSMKLSERLESSPVLLTEGAVVTRLNYEFHLPTPDSAAFVHLFSPSGRAALDAIYRSYMQIAADHDLPMLVSTPTWRAHPEGLARQGFTAPNDLARVNREAVALLYDMRRDMGLDDIVYISGAVGPQFDGYDPKGAPDAAAAEVYHHAQTQILADLDIDLLYAPTFASANELLGISHTFAKTQLHYILAPVINSGGYLPDGSLLRDLVSRVDREVSVEPLCFFIACVHPKNLARAARATDWPGPDRVAGLQANASSLSPEDLNNLNHLEEGTPEDFADRMVDLQSSGIKVLGGCCGTGEAHIRALARRFEPGPSRTN